MSEHISYNTVGTCSRKIEIEVENDIIVEVKYLGGCSGNTQGISALVKGLSVDDAINRLDGIRCGGRPTSCPDQLANALKQYKTKKAE